MALLKQVFVTGQMLLAMSYQQHQSTTRNIYSFSTT